MKLRCLLVDDEPPALKVLRLHISQISGLEIVGQCKNAIEAMDVLHRQPVDLMFLDIKMPKILGTNFLRSLSNPPKVIITTAYREYAIDGFELNVIDYLLKPISFERFVKAINKARNPVIAETSTAPEEYSGNENAFVYLKVDKLMRKIFIKDIIYIESMKDYANVFLSDNRKFLVKQSITALENLLSSHKFIRVHRSFLISLKNVTGYTPQHVLLLNKEIPVGRLYKQNVMDVLDKGAIS